MNLKETKKEHKQEIRRISVVDIDKFDKQFLGESGVTDTPVMATGIDALDEALGGGIALGQHIHIWGKEFSGKTLFAILLAKRFQEEGKKVLWADLEGRFVPQWARSWGLDVDKLLTPKNCTFGEQFMDLFIVRCIKNDVGLIVVDSIPKIVPKAVIDKMTGEKTMGSKPALLSLALDNIDSYRQEIISRGEIPPTFLWINQLRDKIGGYMGGETYPGGHNINHAMFQNIKIKVEGDGYLLADGKKTVTKTDPNVIGYTVGGQIIKNGLTQRDKTFSYGVNIRDREIDNLSHLVDSKKELVRTGAWYKIDWAGEEFADQKLQGEANFKQFLLDDPTRIEKLKDLI